MPVLQLFKKKIFLVIGGLLVIAGGFFLGYKLFASEQRSPETYLVDQPSCVSRDPCKEGFIKEKGQCTYKTKPDGTECGENKYCRGGRCVASAPVSSARPRPSGAEDTVYYYNIKADKKKIIKGQQVKIDLRLVAEQQRQEKVKLVRATLQWDPAKLSLGKVENKRQKWGSFLYKQYKNKKGTVSLVWFDSNGFSIASKDQLLSNIYFKANKNFTEPTVIKLYDSGDSQAVFSADDDQNEKNLVSRRNTETKIQGVECVKNEQCSRLGGGQVCKVDVCINNECVEQERENGYICAQGRVCRDGECVKVADGECRIDKDCDDRNACTKDVCRTTISSRNVCQHMPLDGKECGEGKVCKEGECVLSCKDPDGKNIHKKGTCKSAGSTLIDRCASKESVYEAVCKDNSCLWSREVGDCAEDEVCKNGRCVADLSGDADKYDLSGDGTIGIQDLVYVLDHEGEYSEKLGKKLDIIVILEILDHWGE
jgi:hypothetical protein